MVISIINDCSDSNVQGRQLARVNALFNVNAIFVGVQNDFEAGGCLIDQLDACGEDSGLILANVAPRHGVRHKFVNGTPFAYFQIGQTWVVATVDGWILPFIKKLNLTDEFFLIDLEKTVNGSKIFPESEKERIIRTQFRSFEFSPRIGFLLSIGRQKEIIGKWQNFSEVTDLPQVVWFSDNFGNLKLSALPEDLDFVSGKKIKTRFGEFECFDRLKDLPDGQAGFYVGSSGLGKKRFLELAIQGSSAKQFFDLKSGDLLF